MNPTLILQGSFLLLMLSAPGAEGTPSGTIPGTVMGRTTTERALATSRSLHPSLSVYTPPRLSQAGSSQQGLKNNLVKGCRTLTIPR